MRLTIIRGRCLGLGIACDWRRMEAIRSATHIVFMTPIDRCFQTLSVLIVADDLNGLDLMERGVDEYRDAEQTREVAALTGTYGFGVGTPTRYGI